MLKLFIRKKALLRDRLKNFPRISENEVVVIQAQHSSLIVLDNTGLKFWDWTNSNSKQYLVFKSLKEAEAFVGDKNSRDIEYLFYGHDKAFIKKIVFDKQGVTPIAKKYWFKFWE